MNEKLDIDVKTLKPFTKFIYTIGVLPTSYLMSMTYEEQLVWLCNYLSQTIIPTINNNAEAVKEVQDLVLELQEYINNYFDNLDVQKEINTKLDEMAENGTLTELITKYIDPLYQSFETTVNERLNEQDTQINNINTKVNASVGINPLLANNISDMTDTDRIYVLSTDGNWYYYNGTSWVSGGVYQSTEYGEDTIPSKSIKNVVFDKVDNNIVTKQLTTSNFTNLNNATISEDDDTITIRRTSTTASSQFRINFNFDEVQHGMYILLKLSNLRLIPSLNIVTSNNKTIYNKVLRNGDCYIYLDAEDVKATTTIWFTVYANNYTGVSAGDIYMTIDKEYKICDSTFYNYLSNENLSTILNNLTKYYGITNRYDYYDFNTNFGGVDGIAEIIRNNNNYSITLLTKDRGIKTNTITRTSSILHIKGNVDLVSNPIIVYLIVTDNNNQVHYNGFNFSAGNTIDLSLDLSYYAVYQDMKDFYVVINSSTIGTFKVNNVEIYIDDLADLEIYSNNLGDTLKKIQNKFSELDSNISQNRLIVTSPNNSKYRIIVDNNGNLSTAPVSLNYSKALFIGNSLLNGFGNHGMASYSVDDDYYHYVNEYLLSKNANYTSSKISGTDWESAININQVNNFVNNILTPAMTNDTDVVFIQLGDNCNTTEKINYIPTKAPMLIEAIKNINPNVTIYWIASWYNNTQKQEYIVDTCNNYNITYINIAPLNISTNQAYIGYEYLDSNGDTQTITSSGVASHPSSIGMKAIADLIIEYI